tara:strand:+ start:258 stop:551 length:294 start_codon:yes stop_codon:yes gene_type:complete
MNASIVTAQTDVNNMTDGPITFAINGMSCAGCASSAIWNHIRWNLFWAFIFNVVGLPLVAFGYLSPEVVGLAMALSSITVVANSLLLRGWKPKGMNA